MISRERRYVKFEALPMETVKNLFDLKEKENFRGGT